MSPNLGVLASVGVAYAWLNYLKTAGVSRVNVDAVLLCLGHTCAVPTQWTRVLRAIAARCICPEIQGSL